MIPRMPKYLSALTILAALAIGWHLYDSAIQRPARASAPEPPREPYVATNTKLGEQERLRVVV